MTHGHDDHLGDAIEIVKATGAPLICTPEIGFYAARHGIAVRRSGLHAAECWRKLAHGPVHAHHGNAVHTSEILGYEYARDKTVMPGAGSVGFVIEFKDGPSIYYGGDTGVFSDMAIIRDLYSPDIAILPVGGKYNMGIREAGYAASLVHPKIFIPIHFDTFPNQKQDLDRLEEEIHVRAPHVELVRWKPGDTWEYA